ncbi:MAG: hypothetical protein LBR20_05695 [Propionibacteriaceae bacterium]|jgi:hypothetical protein|nr:hypothetical protein [Propionibacteriaceae bacterium]
MRIKRRIWPLFAIGLTLFTTAAATSAYVDQLHLNFSAAAIGSPEEFRLVVVDEGKVVRHDNAVLPIADSNLLFPGHTLSKQLIVANNHRVIAGDVEVSLDAIGVDGGFDLSGYLRFTVIDQDGTVLMGDKDHPENGESRWDAKASLGKLLGRAKPSLQDGADWVPGSASSYREITILIHLLNHAALQQQHSGLARVLLRLEATTVS